MHKSKMLATLPWTIALGAGLLLLVSWVAWAIRSRPRRPTPLPAEWALSGRPVFSSDERKVYRHLREALPHHVVLAKLPLVRLSQPTDPQQVRYWYELLGTIHVTFVVCSANGRALLAFDLDRERSAASPRQQTIKENVLAACKVRYLRLSVDHLPSVPELQLLLPAARPGSGAPQPTSGEDRAQRLADSPASLRERERRLRSKETGFFQDTFFSAERGDAGTASAYGSLGGILRDGITAHEPGREPVGDSAVAGPAADPAAPPTRR